MKQDANSGKCSILFILANISVKQMKQDANSSKWSILCMLQNSGVRQMKQDINSDRWSSSCTSVDSTTYNFIKGILTSWASQKEFFCFLLLTRVFGASTKSTLVINKFGLAREKENEIQKMRIVQGKNLHECLSYSMQHISSFWKFLTLPPFFTYF